MKKWLKGLFGVMISMMLLVGFAVPDGQAMFKPQCRNPELTVEAVKEGKVTANYAKVKGGKIVFGKSPTAFSPDVLNRILTAYGADELTQDAVAQVQKASKRYASLKDGQIVFGTNATAYSPDVLSKIFEAYGLEFPMESARGMTDPPNYAKIKDGQIVYGTNATAYSPEEFDMLLCAHCLAAEDEFVEAGPKAEPEPMPTEPEPEDVVIPEEPDVEVRPEEMVEPVCPDADGDGVCDQDDDCRDTPRGAFVNSRGCWIIEHLLFDYDKAVIRPQYYPDLDAVIRVLKENPYLNIEIQGHTCNIGSKRYNKPLSERRAKAVYEYFVNRGIDPGRLSTIGYWFSIPAASNDTEEGRALNRRVELHPIR